MIDQAKLDSLLTRAVADLSAGYGGVMMSLGSKLGLYKAMSGAGPISSRELAVRAGCAERYVREWLNAQVAGGYAGYHAVSDTYELTPEQAMVLADEESPVYMPHAWQVPASWNAMLSRFASDVAVLRTVHEGLLDDAVAFARRLGADAVGRLEAGSPTDVLHRIGRTCELLVVASHGARGMTRFMLGSVSHELLFDPPAPMMVTAPRP